MKASIKIKKLLALTLATTITLTNVRSVFADSDGMVVTINGGHTNQSRGASAGGINEEILAKEIKEMVIEKTKNKINAKVSSYSNDLEMRGANKYEDMDARLKYAYEQLSDINIELHFNATQGGEGFEILINPNTPQHIKDACVSFAKEYCEKTGIALRRKNGLYEQEGYKIASYQNDITSITMELGFLGSNDMVGRYDTKENKEKMADIISDGIINNFINNDAMKYDQQIESNQTRDEFKVFEGEDHTKEIAEKKERVQLTKFNIFKSKTQEELLNVLDEKPNAELLVEKKSLDFNSKAENSLLTVMSEVQEELDIAIEPEIQKAPADELKEILEEITPPTEEKDKEEDVIIPTPSTEEKDKEDEESDPIEPDKESDPIEPTIEEPTIEEPTVEEPKILITTQGGDKKINEDLKIELLQQDIEREINNQKNEDSTNEGFIVSTKKLIEEKEDIGFKEVIKESIKENIGQVAEKIKGNSKDLESIILEEEEINEDSVE